MAQIKVTEGDSDNILRIVENYGFKVENLKAFVLPTSISTYENISYPKGHSHISAANIEEQEELFNQFVPEIRNFFLTNKYEITVIRNQTKFTKYEILQNADIILPVITFVGKAAFSIGTFILGRYIYEKYVVISTRNNSTIETDLICFEDKNMKYKRIKISGSAEEVVNALQVVAREEGD